MAFRVLDPDMADFAVVILQTGLRLGEALGLQEQDVDVSRRRLLVQRSWDSKRRVLNPPKNGSPRVIHLTDTALEILTRRMHSRTHPWIFGRRHDRTTMPKHAVWAERWMRLARERLGLPPYVIHSLRHTTGTLMLEGGIDERQTQALLGHRTNAMTKHYTRHAVLPRPPHLDDALSVGRRAPLRADRPDEPGHVAGRGFAGRHR